ncbi:MAG: hypothetical protein ABSC17_05140 [Thermacetogeniaceae bacterium]
MERRQQALREARAILNLGFSIRPIPAADGVITPTLSLDTDRIADAQEVLEAVGYSIPQINVVVCNAISEMRIAIGKRGKEDD